MTLNQPELVDPDTVTILPPIQVGQQVDWNSVIMLMVLAFLRRQSLPEPVKPPVVVVNPSVIQTPSVQVGGVASALAILGQLADVLPPSIGENATTAGVLTTAVPLILTALAPTGVFGSVLSFVRKMFK